MYLQHSYVWPIQGRSVARVLRRLSRNLTIGVNDGADLACAADHQVPLHHHRRLTEMRGASAEGCGCGWESSDTLSQDAQVRLLSSSDAHLSSDEAPLARQVVTDAHLGEFLAEWRHVIELRIDDDCARLVDEAPLARRVVIDAHLGESLAE
jgi:hypothetical protein